MSLYRNSPIYIFSAGVDADDNCNDKWKIYNMNSLTVRGPDQAMDIIYRLVHCRPHQGPMSRSGDHWPVVLHLSSSHKPFSVDTADKTRSSTDGNCSITPRFRGIFDIHYLLFPLVLFGVKNGDVGLLTKYVKVSAHFALKSAQFAEQ